MIAMAALASSAATLAPALTAWAQASVQAAGMETVETVDGRRLRLFPDGRYEWLAPADPVAPPVPSGPLALADILAVPGPVPGRPVELAATVRLLGGRALAVDPDLPGRGLPLGLDALPAGDRARIVRDCGIAGCRLVLTGRIGRDARGPYLDATAIADAE